MVHVNEVRHLVVECKAIEAAEGTRPYGSAGNVLRDGMRGDMEPDCKAMAEMDPSGFVVLADHVPGIVQEIRYHSTYNFVGDRIDGYEEPVALMTREAARALKSVADEMAARGFRLKVFDAYRPARAVRYFAMWGIDDLDQRMKPFFYPDLAKGDILEQGYIAERSAHSRGSTVDLTLLEMSTGKELDMGGPFDFFGEVSHFGYRGITDEQHKNRVILRGAMARNGFASIECEWWHFTLEDEPYPGTYFDFPVSSQYLRQ